MVLGVVWEWFFTTHDYEIPNWAMLLWEFGYIVGVCAIWNYRNLVSKLKEAILQVDRRVRETLEENAILQYEAGVHEPSTRGTFRFRSYSFTKQRVLELCEEAIHSLGYDHLELDDINFPCPEGDVFQLHHNSLLGVVRKDMKLHCIWKGIPVVVSCFYFVVSLTEWKRGAHRSWIYNWSVSDLDVKLRDDTDEPGELDISLEKFHSEKSVILQEIKLMAYHIFEHINIYDCFIEWTRQCALLF